MRQLICHGFPLNTLKLQLLVRTLNVLGGMMASSWYHIGGKALGKLFGGNLPRNVKELMTLLGHLNFMGQFIPTNKRRVWLLQQLMKVMGGRWIEKRTENVSACTSMGLAS